MIIQKTTNPTDWRFVWFLFKLISALTICPWLLTHVCNILQQKLKKRCLKNKVVIITGASSGLGESLAHAFYNCGCRLILVSRRQEELIRIKDALLQNYHTTPTDPPIILPLDLTNFANTRFIVIAVLKIYGQIDILINNAGILYRGSVLNTYVDVDMKLMLTNFFSQVNLTKSILPFMINQGYGHIVSINSVQGRIAIPFRSAYAASKHALQAWYDTARAELSDKNIKFTVVNPGYIKTSLFLNALTGNRDVYGIMDKTTGNGYETKYVAEYILKSVLREKNEVTIAPFSAKCAIVLRTFYPSLFFWVMQRYAKN